MFIIIPRKFDRTFRGAVCLNHLRNVSSKMPVAAFIENNLEAPVVVVGKDNVDLIGPPDPVSNLRPIIRKCIVHETTLQQKLREMQNETQTWNQDFWRKHNTKFARERQEYINLHLMKNVGQQPPTADEMSDFYKRFLDENWESHVNYNFEWYKRNFTLLLLSLSVSVESIFRRS